MAAEQHTERELDEIREEQTVLAQTTITQLPPGVPGNPDAPVKRGRGRPKGSKNKKTIDAMAGGLAPGSSSTSQPGEKRKRGRPPKSQEAADAASGKAPSKKPRGRPPKNHKSQTGQQQATLGGSGGGVALGVQGEEAASMAKRMRTDGNE